MIYDITVESILTGALIFVRISAMLYALPFFGDEPIPTPVRLILGVALAYGFHDRIPAQWGTVLPTDMFPFGIMVFKEVMIGLFVGFVGRLAFDGILMAASLVGYQMGFGTADLIYPGLGTQVSAFTAMHRGVMMLIFLSLNLHHIYLDGIIKTFDMIPAGAALPSKNLMPFFIQLTSGVFRVAMQLSAPVLVALIFANSALGLAARTVPQLNVFTMSFPIGFFVGMTIYMACLPFFPEWTLTHFELSQGYMIKTIQGLMP
ncbi:MAG: flagellar biosynthetic protein FliR [Chitinophagaceae bacterium]|nr:flagellar biosynthetic protein FliR [Oligoflexus sp.]